MMNTQVIFCLTLALLVSGAHLATVSIKNNCPYTIWPATLTSDNKPQLPLTGFVLPSQQKKTIDVGGQWKGRFWARTRCARDASGKFTCGTGDCGSGQVECNGKGGVPPASLVEINIVGNNGQDVHDVSLVDGFNLPVAVVPQGGSGAKCKSATCRANVNSKCPSQLALKGPDGSTIGCKSACVVFNQPQYCCTPPKNTTQTCGPTQYSKIFKDQCPEAYSYAFDDPTSLFFCTRATNYAITFCP